MCWALRFCLPVYDPLSPLGINWFPPLIIFDEQTLQIPRPNYVDRNLRYPSIDRVTGPGMSFPQKNVGTAIAPTLIAAFVYDKKVVCY